MWDTSLFICFESQLAVPVCFPLHQVNQMSPHLEAVKSFLLAKQKHLHGLDFRLFDGAEALWSPRTYKIVVFKHEKLTDHNSASSQPAVLGRAGGAGLWRVNSALWVVD